VSTHPPRILLLYGSLRERSYSKLLTVEAERLLKEFGCETRIFDPAGLPLPDAAPAEQPKVQELRDLSIWSEGHVWCSPERHGAIHGNHQEPNRLAAAGDRRRSPDAGTHACRHAGVRWLAVV
jgi:arsenic resistance protein ArsH